MVSKKVVFLLDISGSMAVKDQLPEEASPEPRGSTTAVKDRRKKAKKDEEKPDPEDIPDSRRRLRRVQKELIAVIHKLPPQTSFNIITFNHEIRHFRNQLIMATDANKRRASKFVRDFVAEGETWTDAALEAAFDVAGVNTIFLLSDGAPRRNDTLLHIKPILNWMRDANRFRRIRIHTVGFKQAGSNLKRFMKKLATQNHGLYKELK